MHRGSETLKELVQHEEGDAFAARFAPELAVYTEVISSLSGATVGVMTRGEDASFTERVQATLAGWGAPEAGLAWHRKLAGWFEHERAFFKAEWTRTTPEAAPQRLGAFYYRRRPEVEEVVAALRAEGVAPAQLERFEALARLLAKDSVHFVSAAVREGSDEVVHKLYLSQWVTPDTQAAVQGRITRALRELGVHADNIDLWSLYHDRLAPAASSPSIFVSLAFTAADRQPSLKIDYPEVLPRYAVALLPAGDQPAAQDAAQRFCARCGLERISYLGVRLGEAPGIGIKLYGDFHGE